MAREVPGLDRRGPRHPPAARHPRRTRLRTRHPGGDTVVITIWPSDEVFDAWIATPHRDALTASEVHQAVSYRPITRYEVTGGYLNLPGLTICDPSPQPAPASEEPS